MGEYLFLDHLWNNQPRPHKELIACTRSGPCEAAGKLAQRLLSAEEADEVEHLLAQRRCTAVLKKRLQTFDKEISYVAALFATPVLLCILGGGRLLKSCAMVDHTGRREVFITEARRAYLEGVPIVSVDVEETLAVALRAKDSHFPKLSLKAPPAPAPAPALAPAPAPVPAPAPNSTEQLLARHEAALTALEW